VDGDRVGVGEFVEFVERVVDRFVLVGEYGQLVVFERHARDHADGAVEDARGALLVVVTQLGDLVPDPEHPPAVAALGLAFAERGEPLLEEQVEVARPGGAAVHRAEHLHIATGVKAELGWDAARHDVDQEFRGLLVVVAAEPEEVVVPPEGRLVSGVDPVRVDHDPRLLGLPEDLRQPHHGQRARGEHVPQHLARPDRGQLVDVSDQEQVRARRDRLDQLVGQDHVHHRRLVHHDQVGVERGGRVEGRLAARP
jgi:hypothetical protein